jgi:hypothetical protein
MPTYGIPVDRRPQAATGIFGVFVEVLLSVAQRLPQIGIACIDVATGISNQEFQCLSMNSNANLWHSCEIADFSSFEGFLAKFECDIRYKFMHIINGFF